MIYNWTIQCHPDKDGLVFLVSSQGVFPCQRHLWLARYKYINTFKGFYLEYICLCIVVTISFVNSVHKKK